MAKSVRFIQIALAIITLAGATVVAKSQNPSWQWREIAAATGEKPEARRNGVAVHDPVAKRVILFGG
ncbi:MAG: hypothetical protein ACREEM_44175, partial [Blastocatellia bacterium]